MQRIAGSLHCCAVLQNVEPNYHQLTDEVSTLDLDNMAKIIEAIALSSATIIKGTDTPSRVKPESLQ